MPGEMELAERFGVSRHTVREALRQLTALGLIDRRRALGTVVKARQTSDAYVHSIGTPAELLQYPTDSYRMIQSTGLVKANRQLARLLDCPTGTRWFRFSLLRRFKSARRAPICWTDVYVLPEYSGVARLLNRRSQYVHELIEKHFDARLTGVRVQLRAETLDGDKAAALRCPPGSPALTVIRRYQGQAASGKTRPIEVSVAWHPADRFTYAIELRRAWQSGTGWTAS